MVTRYHRKHLTWVDLAAPESQEVRALMEEFDLHPLIADELLTPSTKQKAEALGNHLYIVLHIPMLSDSGEVDATQEIDFIVGKNFLITTRYESLDRLHAFAKEFERDTMLGHAASGPAGSHLLFHMVDWLYREMGNELEMLQGALNNIEDRIFKGKEKEMVSELSHGSRSILDFRRALLPHRELLSSLELVGGKLFGQDFSFYARTLQGKQAKITAQLEELRDLLNELRETNNSLLSTKQNEIMKVLTIMAFVTFPLSLISSVFGMNTKYLPLVGLPGDFWIVIGGMATLTACFFIFFKKMKWL